MNEKQNRGLVEEISVTDSGKYGGFVILKDNKTGKYIFRKHNMIVNEGKKVLAASLFGHFYDEEQQNNFSDTSNESVISGKEYEGYTLRYLFISDDASETTFDLTYAELAATTSFTGGVTSSGSSYSGYVYAIPSSEVPITFQQDENSLKYSIQMQLELSNSISLTSVSSLGLLMANESGDCLLFSRINFDIIPIADDTTYTMIYYVYL